MHHSRTLAIFTVPLQHAEYPADFLICKNIWDKIPFKDAGIILSGVNVRITTGYKVFCETTYDRPPFLNVLLFFRWFMGSPFLVHFTGDPYVHNTPVFKEQIHLPQSVNNRITNLITLCSFVRDIFRDQLPEWPRKLRQLISFFIVLDTGHLQ